MARSKKEPVSISAENVTAWYTAGEAAKKLSENSKRNVSASYVQKLSALGKVRTLKMHSRFTLYSKEDIDAYRVERRGKKSGEAAKARSSRAARTTSNNLSIA